MDQARLDELLRGRIMDVFELSIRAMTPDAKARALESAGISDFLMEIIMSVPSDAPEQDWQRL